MKQPKNKTPWRIVTATVILLSILSFTPLVIPVGRTDPFLMGLPYTLWMGMFIAFLIVFLTWLGTRFHPEEEDF